VLSVFDLPHVFIVFAPGAGGNFLAGLYAGLINGEHADIAIAKSGSTHNNLSLTGKLAMGTFIDTSNADEKIKYHRELFSKLEVTQPLVSWTHDFKNIALYRSIFPNSKIVVITQTTKEEQLSVTYMNVTKNLMDPNVATRLPAAQLKFIQESYRQSCIDKLMEHMSKNQVNLIFSDPKYNDVVNYLYIKGMINFYGLQHLVEDVPEISIPEIIQYGVTNKPYDIDQYLTDKCVLFPYSCFMSGNDTILLETITNTLSRELTTEEKMFVETNFIKYRDKQNLKILTDPVAYYQSLKEACSKIKLG
jgi:hypothetical protein